MAIATYDELVRRQQSPRERNQYSKGTSGQFSVGRLSSMWVVTPEAGVAPTTAAVPSRTIVGAVGQENGGANALRLPAIDFSTSMPYGTLILCDRLSHQGGLSGTVTTAQTTNLPTAALTRYTSGVGVMCALEVYSAVGATATTVSVSYTDQDGNTGQISPLVVFGSGLFSSPTRMIIIPCAAGDTGFRAVASVTVTATTGTAGNFGVVLFKPLVFLPVVSGQAFLADPLLGTMGGGLPEILDEACLFWIALPGSTTAGQQNNAGLRFAED